MNTVLSSTYSNACPLKAIKTRPLDNIMSINRQSGKVNKIYYCSVFIRSLKYLYIPRCDYTPINIVILYYRNNRSNRNFPCSVIIADTLCRDRVLYTFCDRKISYTFPLPPSLLHLLLLSHPTLNLAVTPSCPPLFITYNKDLSLNNNKLNDGCQ